VWRYGNKRWQKKDKEKQKIGRNRNTPNPASPSLEDLVYSLTQSVQGLNATVAALSTSVSMVVGALSQQNGSSCGLVVKKPTSFEGKDFESA
jgi:hypothetical protein